MISNCEHRKEKKAGGKCPLQTSFPVTKTQTLIVILEYGKDYPEAKSHDLQCLQGHFQLTSYHSPPLNRLQITISPYSLPVSTNSISCHRNCAQDVDRYCTFLPRKLANQIKYELLISDNILWSETLHLPFQFFLSHFSPFTIASVWTTNWYPNPRCSTSVPLLVLCL